MHRLQRARDPPSGCSAIACDAISRCCCSRRRGDLWTPSSSTICAHRGRIMGSAAASAIRRTRRGCDRSARSRQHRCLALDLKPGEFAANIKATAARSRQVRGRNSPRPGSPPDRQRLKEKNPAQFQKFTDQAAGLLVGLANAYRGVWKPRPPIYAAQGRRSRDQDADAHRCRPARWPGMKPSQFLAGAVGRVPRRRSPRGWPFRQHRGTDDRQPARG